MGESKESSKNGQTPDEIDIVEECTGDVWRFQCYALMLMAFSQFPTAFHPMNIVFLAPPVSYTCLDNYTDITNNTCPCQNPVYDREIFEETIITTWGLICNRQWLVSVSQTCFQLGILLGSITFGSLSDRFGRKRPLVAGNILQLSAGISAAFVTNFWLFTFFRFIIGMTIGCTLVTSYVLQMELSTKSRRDFISVLFQFAYNVAYIIMPLFGYLLRNWRYLEFALSLPTVAVISYIWLMPESPRWHLAVGQTDEAIKVMKKMAKFNKMPTDNIEERVKQYQQQMKQSSTVQQKSGTMIDLFRTTNIRKRIILMAMIWIVCAFGYFGLSTYVGQLNGDIFVNLTLLAAINWIGSFVSHFLLKFMKRRHSLIATLLTSSTCMLVIAILNDDNIVRVLLACIGAVGMFVAFVIVYLYTAELFPTVVRNAALGVTSMFARIGSMVAAFVAYMGVFGTWVPPLVFGVAPLFAAVICYFMVETKGCVLTTTLEEGENFGIKSPNNKNTTDLLNKLPEDTSHKVSLENGVNIK